MPLRMNSEYHFVIFLGADREQRHDGKRGRICSNGQLVPRQHVKGWVQFFPAYEITSEFSRFLKNIAPIYLQSMPLGMKVGNKSTYILTVWNSVHEVTMGNVYKNNLFE